MTTTTTLTTTTFPFEFDWAYRIAAAPFGIRPSTTQVTVTGQRLRVDFGPWHLETARSNIADVNLTGPYSRLKTIGPAHLSFTDRGMTCATNNRRGLCVTFREPVPGIEPTGRLRHPGVTVTVADVDGLSARLRPGS